jgi:recombination protein RecA
MEKVEFKMDKDLEQALRQIHKQFGKESISLLSSGPDINVDWLSSGSLKLDTALGGGYPRGRIIELFGGESSGKTTLCLTAIAEAQRQGLMCAFIDVEHALDPIYAEKLGVDLDRLLLSQPDTGEQALEIVEALVRSGAVALIVLDSVAALVTTAEINGEMGQSHIGLLARLMSQAMRKLAGACSKTNTLLMFTNQIREKIGVMYGNPETTPGGRALKFYSSQRLSIHRMNIKDKNVKKQEGQARVTVVKNKVAAPYGVCELIIEFNKGIVVEDEIFELAIDYDLIEKNGSYYKYVDEETDELIFNVQGTAKVEIELLERPELREKLMAQIKQKITGGQRANESEKTEF